MDRRIAFAVLLVSGLAWAQEQKAETLTPYSVQEIENLLQVFKDTYNDSHQPEADAITVLADLRKAYAYLASKPEAEISKDEEKLKRTIVRDVARGLKARDRPSVTAECAAALGAMGDDAAGRDLVRWMESVVLDAKQPQPVWLEKGFLAMAHIGLEDPNTIKLMTSYTTGRHMDLTVTAEALKALTEWKHLSGRNRKDLFERILGYLQGIFNGQKKGGSDGAVYKERWERVGETGMATLNELAGMTFADPEQANEWWKENKRARWEDYVGRPFRTKEAAGTEEGGAAEGT